MEERGALDSSISVRRSAHSRPGDAPSGPGGISGVRRSEQPVEVRGALSVYRLAYAVINLQALLEGEAPQVERGGVDGLDLHSLAVDYQNIAQGRCEELDLAANVADTQAREIAVRSDRTPDVCDAVRDGTRGCAVGFRPRDRLSLRSIDADRKTHVPVQ